MRLMSTFRMTMLVGASLLLCASTGAYAQNMPAANPEERSGGYPPSAPVVEPAPIPGSVLLDRVVAVINGDVILESDVLEEERFTRLQAFRAPGGGSAKEQALQQLINRTLILQQIKEQQNPLQVSDAELKSQLDDLRKHLPACANNKCGTEAGWKEVLAAQGFTEEEFDQKWRQRVKVLKFTEQRFRAGIRISKPEVQDYYARQFVPRFEKRKLTPPPLASVSARIDEILLQQHVNVLLQEWLNSLKDEGSVAILDPQYGQIGRPVDDQDEDE